MRRCLGSRIGKLLPCFLLFNSPSCNAIELIFFSFFCVEQQRKIKELTEEAATTKDSLAALTTVVTSLATTSGSAEEVAKAKEILLSIKEEVMEKETDPPSDVSLLIGHIAALEQLFDTSAKKLASGSANKENEVPTVTNKKILTDSSNANQNAQPALVRRRPAM